MTLRLEEKQVEIDGRTYVCRCNMAVLDRIQEAVGGSIAGLFEMPSHVGIFEIFKAMLDDYCEDAGLPAVEMRRLKKLFSPAQLADLGVLRMFTESITVTPPAMSAADTGAQPETADSGN